MGEIEARLAKSTLEQAVGRAWSPRFPNSVTVFSTIPLDQGFFFRMGFSRQGFLRVGFQDSKTRLLSMLTPKPTFMVECTKSFLGNRVWCSVCDSKRPEGVSQGRF